MIITIRGSSIALAVALGNGLIATQAVAQGEGFVEGASATLSNRTFYFNRDFRDNVGQSKREETATGFALHFQSSDTEGPVSQGYYALSQDGLQPDSCVCRACTGV